MDSVREAKERLVTKGEHGCEFEAPDMYLVEVDNWKPEQYGPLDEAKIVDKKIFGKMRRGAYIQTGQAGHFKVKDFERTVVTHVKSMMGSRTSSKPRPWPTRRRQSAMPCRKPVVKEPVRLLKQRFP